jgi:hypothetical protein
MLLISIGRIGATSGTPRYYGKGASRVATNRLSGARQRSGSFAAAFQHPYNGLLSRHRPSLCVREISSAYNGAVRTVCGRPANVRRVSIAATAQGSEEGRGIPWSDNATVGTSTDATHYVVPPHITILHQDQHCVVVSKPPAVVCHHSGWAGSKSRAKNGEPPEIPMLQRIRDNLGGRHVNLIHRLDRGASGCLVCAFAEAEGADAARVDEHENDTRTGIDRQSNDNEPLTRNHNKGQGPTAQLIDALQSSDAAKTYVALV